MPVPGLYIKWHTFLMIVSCHSILQPADWPYRAEPCPAHPGPPMLSGVRVPLGAAPDSCVVPLYSLSPSACLPPPPHPSDRQGHGTNTSSVNLTPDVHGIVGGKLPGHSILAVKANISLHCCTELQVTAQWEHIADSRVAASELVDILCVLSRIDEMKLPFNMPFTMQCISSDYVSLRALSPASLRGDHFHQDFHPPPLQ